MPYELVWKKYQFKEKISVDSRPDYKYIRNVNNSLKMLHLLIISYLPYNQEDENYFIKYYLGLYLKRFPNCNQMSIYCCQYFCI